MVDFGTLVRIINAAQAIQQAAENVEQNQKDCEEMGGHVALLTTQLERLGNNGPLMMDPAVSPAVAKLEEILREALELVKECQVKRNIIHLQCTAGALSRKLRRMNERIMRRTMLLMCAVIGRQECQRPTQEVNQLTGIEFVYLFGRASSDSLYRSRFSERSDPIVKNDSL